jgi:hypothetical protein
MKAEEIIMRKLAILALSAAALTGAPALAESSLTGVWALTTQTQQGPREATLTVMEPDGVLVAMLEQQPPAGTQPAPSTISDVVVDGDHFTFKRAMNAGGQAMNWDYEGTIDGDTLTATATSGDLSFEVTGEREQ